RDFHVTGVQTCALPILSLTDECLITRDPVGSEGREVGDRLDEVRLALPVAADDEVRAGRESERRGLVVAEVGEFEVRDEHDPQALRTACPPNCWRRAATAFIPGEAFWPDTHRAQIEAEIVGTGTALLRASSTVHRPSPESSTYPSMSVNSGSSSSAFTSSSSSQPRTTVPRCHALNTPVTSWMSSSFASSSS